MSRTPADRSTAGRYRTQHEQGRFGQPGIQKVGVLGGGQLGKMLALDAARMGVNLSVLDPAQPACPAAVAAPQVVGSFQDPAAIRRFAAGLDILTVEIEHIDAEALEEVASHLTVEPEPATLRIIQDKLKQKEHFTAHDIAVAPFVGIASEADAQAAAARFGYPFMLKACRMAYDGRGNAAVNRPEDLSEAVTSLGGYGAGLYAEQWVPFDKELAVMVVRSRSGRVRAFPVVQTLHRDSILWVTEAPANVPPTQLAQAEDLAARTVSCLQGAGVFGVEMFALPDKGLMVNEVAPRPHNSGHYTIEACASSQFEQHLRAVLDWPLASTDLVVGASIMLNILGSGEGEEGLAAAHDLISRAYQTPGASVHWAPEAAAAGIARAEQGGAAPLSSPAAAGFSRSGAQPQVGIIMGSDSDFATMRAAAEALQEFDVACEVTVVSAHRTPLRLVEYGKSAHKRGIKVIIAGAGGAAHLPGMVAALTPLPVIGVPVTPPGAHLDGLDALLSIVQMPRGVPVATVAIGNAANAGLLAARILAAHDTSLLLRMQLYQEDMEKAVLQKAEKVEAAWRDSTAS
ncbi:hypothetical protein WJX73_002964 [Symbiochloris irregularis]|uniref:phosphoribosylaminoimidazole carboxylase n=1 Tax=Symbiochloris irregularis TaxID=706552 RepID=A0AAW1NPM4_9CHLO